MPLLEIIGWIGSALVVVSLMQARVLRFRVLNLVGSLIATGYNAWVGIWPFAVMNGVIAVIDIYWLWRLLRERHDEQAYEVVEVGGTRAPASARSSSTTSPRGSGTSRPASSCTGAAGRSRAPG
jgi:hypothetical protein